MQYILGISAFYHDSAAALICDGKIVAAAQEERFTRVKHDPTFPAQAIAYCLKEAGIRLDDLDAIVFYDKPLLKFERLLETFLRYAPRGFRSFITAMPVWLKEKLYLKQVLRRELRTVGDLSKKAALPPLLFTEHHQSHAASAYYPSPFTDAAVLCLDGVGEWVTTSLWRGQGATLQAISEIAFPHSLGLLYSAFTSYCGFRVNSGEYKLMGLAPYGRPVYVQAIYDNLIDVKEDGSFCLDMTYFAYEIGKTMTSERFHQLFGGQPYDLGAVPDQRCMDLARSIQVVVEETVVKMAATAKRLTGSQNLCLAGGVALNCVANGKIREARLFDKIWVQPAAGDAGGALGAALACWYLRNPDEKRSGEDSMRGAALGPAYSNDDAIHSCKRWDVPYKVLDGGEKYPHVATLLSDGKVIGWFQGRMEFGPRALGNRSILGDPANASLQSVMNLKIKQRESFRPFAPAVLREHASDYFDSTEPSPYMLDVASVCAHRCKTPSKMSSGLAQVNDIRSDIPAVTHVDYSARVQTVDASVHPVFHRLISAFGALTGLPMVINTSFNVRGEPPVCSPDDAIRCFLATDMDYLIMEDILLDKSQMPSNAIQLARQHTFRDD